MLDRDKFLTLAIKLRKIDNHAKAVALNHQRRLRSIGQVRPVGEILVGAHLMDNSAIDEILKHQAEVRRGMASRIRALAPDAPSVVAQQAILAVTAVAGALLLHRFRSMSYGASFGLAGAVLALAYPIHAFANQRSSLLTFRKAVWFFFALLLVACIVYTAITVHGFTAVGADHSPEAAARVAGWLLHVRLAFAAMATALLLVLAYAAWKFHCQRVVECRVTLLKDILIRVENLLADKDVDKHERESRALSLVVKGLRNVFKIGLLDRLAARLRPDRVLTTVLFLTPDEEGGDFTVRAAAFPESCPDRVKTAVDWLTAHHRPRFLDEDRYMAAKDSARGLKPQGWKARFLNFRDRHEYVSACGWMRAKKCTLISSDASQCLAFDHTHVEQVREAGLVSKEELRWFQVGSFIGSPVVTTDGDVDGIVLVLRNHKRIVAPEDLEVVTVASQVIRRVLCSTKEDGDGRSS